jgi:hypothetical protein
MQQSQKGQMMGYPKEQPPPAKAADPIPHESGHTTPSTVGAEPAPRLPHEHDESSDSQTSQPREVIKQAHDDLANGLVDTDRGPVLEQLYEERVGTDATPPRGAPHGSQR